MVSPQFDEIPMPSDVAGSDRLVEEWAPHLIGMYETRLRYHEELGDDSVPYASAHTGTQVFAAAFGCPVHIYPDSPTIALPCVTTADEADRIDLPAIDAPPLDRVWRAAEMMRERLGPDVPIGVPDIQSALDIAALIWRKEDFLLALLETPDAALGLIEKCRQLLTAFLVEFKRRLGEVNYCHCPYAWARPELGVWLSEDEVGAISTEMFEQFALPSLTQLSETFGGIFMHCCATADHQYDNFKRVPNLRGLNRVFQEPGARPAIEAFTPDTVLMLAWYDEQKINETLDLALPETRFLFNLSACPIDEAKPAFERLRERCPRRSASTGLTTEVAEVTQQAKDG